MEGDNGDDENENGFDDDVDDSEEASPSMALSSEDPETSGLMAARGAWKTVWGLRSDCVNSVWFPMM